jgi:hypothetical protein
MSIPPDSTSKEKPVHLLADEELRRFILDFVNLQADRTQFVWKLAKRHPKMVPLPEDIEGTLPEDLKGKDDFFGPGYGKYWLESFFWYLLDSLRCAWREPDGYERTAELASLHYRVWATRQRYDEKHSQAAFRVSGCLFNVFLAMRLADQDQDKMAICQNPECCTPYYFLCKKGQRFCSEKCSGVGNREAKRRWWTKHGKKWRKGRISKQRKTKGRKP